MTPLSALLTGLTIGGLTCFAVQGGLLLGLLARRNGEEEHLSRWQRLLLPVSAFMVAKITAYTIVGFFFGWLGDRVQLSDTARLWFQLVAAVFMIVAGIRLIVPHWLPWLAITPPASIRRLVRKSAKSEAIVAPALLGFLMVLIPCGTTQAMEIAAIASGSAGQGAAILFAFTLGTAPMFFLIGILAKGSALFQKRLSYAAATLVIGLGLYAFNGVLVSVDSPYSFQNEAAAFRRVFGGTVTEANSGPSGSATANPVIAVRSNGYAPKAITVPAGEPVRLMLKTDENYGCTSIFRIPKLKIEKALPATGTTTIAANFPQPGTYSFSCGMGMYTGTITAI